MTGDYYLTVSPKWFAYTIEYYEQNTTGSGYSKVSSPAGSGTAPFGYALQLGTTAGTNDSTKTVTVTRSDITGFTFNSAAAGSVTNLTAISARPPATDAQALLRPQPVQRAGLLLR